MELGSLVAHNLQFVCLPFGLFDLFRQGLRSVRHLPQFLKAKYVLRLRGLPLAFELLLLTDRVRLKLYNREVFVLDLLLQLLELLTSVSFFCHALFGCLRSVLELLVFRRARAGRWNCARCHQLSRLEVCPQLGQFLSQGGEFLSVHQVARVLLYATFAHLGTGRVPASHTVARHATAQRRLPVGAPCQDLVLIAQLAVGTGPRRQRPIATSTVGPSGRILLDGGTRGRHWVCVSSPVLESPHLCFRL
mmetsp:Transcript_115829/g.327688  ORF Transcript_115829/g.327688 Transcript_115829/m.327688 type:complete len:248 (-) Transcript_115829:168-911(-)